MNYDNFVRQNLPYHLQNSTSFGEQEIAHVAHGLKEIHGKILGKFTHGLGSFCQAVYHRDFYSALKQADDINQVAIYVYVVFMYNYAPSLLK